MFCGRSGKFVRFRSLIAAILACTTGAISIASSQDGGPIVIGEHEKLQFFKLEDYRASVDVYWRYRSDESKPNTGNKIKDTESLFRETINMSGEGFFGNPNLVKLNMNISLVLSQEKIESDSLQRNERTSEIISEYDISAIVLQQSDTPLTLYSNQSEILRDRQFADSLDSTTVEHGARLTLRSDFMPSQIHYFRREQEQSGRFTGTDSTLIQDSFSWSGRLKPVNGHRLWWDYTFSNVDEAGQLQVSNSYARHDGFLNHTLDFGDDNKYNLRSSFRFYKETGKFPIERFRWTESLRLNHTSDFETRYDYLFDQQKRRGTNQTLHRGSASFRHDLFDSLTTTGQIGASILSITDGDFESTQLFGDLGTQYRKIVPLGVLDATANVNWNRTDDSDRGASIFITDEPHTFGVSGFITINRRNIVGNSVVVTDAAGIVIYVQGVDYTVRVFAESLEIRRVLGGNIAPGQAVLITYEIGPEPASTTDTMGYGLTIRYRFEEGPLKGVSPFIRYRDQSQDRTGRDVFNLPKIDFQDLVFGVDYDIRHVSLTAQHQIHDSVVSPYETTRLECRYTNRINSRNSLNLSAYFQDTDRVDENLQTTITNVTARWNAQATEKLRTSMVCIWRKEEDSLGADSDAYEVALDLTWRHRQTTVYCTLRNSFVSSTTRDNTFQTFIFGVRREF